MALALVVEVVHLLGDHVGRITDPGEHAEIFEEWGDDLAVPGRARHVGEDTVQPAPPSGVGRKDVPHAGTGLEGGHGRSG